MKSIAILSAFTAGIAAQSSACPPLELIYARATGEPPVGVDNASAAQFETEGAKTWSKGYGAAGYSLYANLTQLVPGATGYPVHYPASFGTGGKSATGTAGMETSGGKGVTDAVQYITKRAKDCPQTKFALGGHSQGGMVTVGAIPKIPADILSRVIAVTMFGAPPCPDQVKDRCNSYCYKGDFVCDPSAPGSKVGNMPKVERRWPIADENLSGALTKREGPLADCSKYGPSASIQIDGRTAGVPGNSHLAYNADGYYVWAAACYVAEAYKKAGGAGSAAVAPSPAALPAPSAAPVAQALAEVAPAIDAPAASALEGSASSAAPVDDSATDASGGATEQEEEGWGSWLWSKIKSLFAA